MGCYWRNVSQSLRWGNVERCDPSPIKVEVLANRMEPGHFLSQSFQPTFVVLCLQFCINLAHSHVKKQRLILTLFVFFVKWLTLSFLCIMLAICKIFKLLWSQLRIRVDSWVYYPLLFFIKGCVSSHYINVEMTLMCGNTSILEFCVFLGSFM